MNLKIVNLFCYVGLCVISNSILAKATIFTNKGDCKAYILKNHMYCEYEDCKGIVTNNISLCESQDCKALVTNNAHFCTSLDCRALVMNKKLACSPEKISSCIAIFEKDVNKCVDKEPRQPDGYAWEYAKNDLEILKSNYIRKWQQGETTNFTPELILVKKTMSDGSIELFYSLLVVA